MLVSCHAPTTCGVKAKDLAEILSGYRALLDTAHAHKMCMILAKYQYSAKAKHTPLPTISFNMVLLSDKVMAQAELASSNPLYDALSSAPIALAMFAALLSLSELTSTQLCELHKSEGECIEFANYISFFAYALLVAYVTVLVDAGMYYRRQQNQQQQSSHQQQEDQAHEEQQQEDALEPAQ